MAYYFSCVYFFANYKHKAWLEAVALNKNGKLTFEQIKKKNSCYKDAEAMGEICPWTVYYNHSLCFDFNTSMYNAAKILAALERERCTMR